MTKKHLTRQQLIRAAGKKTEEFEKHLAECPDCREVVRFFSAFPVAGQIPLTEPPAAWTQKAVALVKSSEKAGVFSKLKARIVFDSWTTPQPVGIRGVNGLSHRRLRFECRDILFDLRAEKHKDSWLFIAQTASETSAEILLKLDKKIISPEPDGLYQWQAKRPPRKITLLADKNVIELPELSWKKPRQK